MRLIIYVACSICDHVGKDIQLGSGTAVEGILRQDQVPFFAGLPRARAGGCELFRGRYLATFGSLTRRLVPSMPIGSLAAGVASSAWTSFPLRVCVDVPIGLGACRALLRSASSAQRKLQSSETENQATAILRRSLNIGDTRWGRTDQIIKRQKRLAKRVLRRISQSARLT